MLNMNSEICTMTYVSDVIFHDVEEHNVASCLFKSDAVAMDTHIE